MTQTRLKQLREDAVLTVHELAKASGVSDDTISKIENGQRVARPATLRKLASALDVSPQELRRPAKVEEPVPLGEAPREAGRPDEERSAHDIARSEAQRQFEIGIKAFRRTIASEGTDHAARVSDIYAPGVYDALKRQPPGELAGTLLDAERHVAYLEHENANLREALAHLEAEAEQESVHGGLVPRGIRRPGSTGKQ